MKRFSAFVLSPSGFSTGLLAMLLCQPAFVSLGADHPKPNIRIDASALPDQVKARSSFAPVAKKIAPSVVNVYSTRQVKEGGESPLFNDPFFRRFFGEPEERGTPQPPHRQQGLGSGVIVSEDGYIVTNTHVVEDSKDIRVALTNGKEYSAEVIGTDPASDIAILKVDATGLPAITLTDSAKIEVGDVVLAVGNPFGVGQTVTMGIVSATGRGGFGIVDYEDFIQTDASINPGNSGGALTDVTGRLIGINTAIISRTGGNQGIGFAVPINMVRYAMNQIIEHGRVIRGQLGVYIQPLTSELARAFNVPEGQKGALVASVNPKSPAAEAGLKEGDVITEFNGKKVQDSRHLRLMVSQTPPDSRVDLTVLRNGRERELTATLSELKPQNLARGRGPEVQFGRSSFLEGLEVAELDSQNRSQFNIPSTVDGLVIVQVEPGSSAERAGLRPGDVITEVNREPVSNLREARSLERKAENGSVLLRVWSDGANRYAVVNTAEAKPQPETPKR